MLGMPVWVLRATMSRDEFYKWISYLQNKPPDITEQQLAVLSTIVSNAVGGKAKVKDFMVSKTPQTKPKKMTAADLRASFGMNIVKKA